jgi:hypothetical protein
VQRAHPERAAQVGETFGLGEPQLVERTARVCFGVAVVAHARARVPDQDHRVQVQAHSAESFEHRAVQIVAQTLVRLVERHPLELVDLVVRDELGR